MRNFAKNLILSVFLLLPVAAFATVDARSIVGAPAGQWHLSVTGEITPADASRVAAWRRQYGRIQFATLESPGGDIRAAMDIGRMLRADLAEGTANSCASACVLVYVGLVSRPYLRDGNLAIHRAIGAHGAPTYAQEKILVDQRNAWIESYLRDMNISARLLDAMNEVPSYRVRHLSQSEAESYGISEFDPVFFEQRQGDIARKLGISMLDAQRRTMARVRQCDALTSSDANANGYQARTACVRSIGLM